MYRVKFQITATIDIDASSEEEAEQIFANMDKDELFVKSEYEDSDIDFLEAEFDVPIRGRE